MSYDLFTNKVRISTYEMTVRTGRVPGMAEVAAALDADLKQVRAAYESLSESHAFMIDPGSGELWRAAPFSAVPTPFPVQIGSIEYYGNCIWDALGIAAAMDSDADISTSCGCCNQPLTLAIRHSELADGEGLVHIAVPARDWYKDVVFTWKTMLLFRSEQHIDRWCQQWNRPRGGVLTLAQGWQLARRWYGDRLKPEWQPMTTEEAQSAFGQIGMQGSFWKLG